MNFVFSSWDAALKYSGVELELFDNEEMWKFVEDNIRGGVATISHRRAVANNKHMSDYDSSAPSTCLFYTDAVKCMDGRCLNICQQVCAFMMTSMHKNKNRLSLSLSLPASFYLSFL